MRLIDADALMEDSNNDPVGKVLIERYNLDGFIEHRATVDAVPVIRCKECRYYDKEWKDCSQWSTLYEVRVREDEYCSRAERREE